MTCSAETPVTSSPTTAKTPEVLARPELAPTTLRLPVELRRQLEWVVDASYPFEACGVMIGHADREKIFVEDVFHARNLSAERARDRFLLDPEDHLAADRVARRRGLDVVGFWHSHPDHPAKPSATDLDSAWEDHSYLIVSAAAAGTGDFRSWRLHDGQFLEERIRQPK